MPTDDTSILTILRRAEPYLIAALAISALWFVVRVWSASHAGMILFTAVLFFLAAAGAFLSVLRERGPASDRHFGTFALLTICYVNALMQAEKFMR